MPTNLLARSLQLLHLGGSGCLGFCQRGAPRLGGLQLAAQLIRLPKKNGRSTR